MADRAIRQRAPGPAEHLRRQTGWSARHRPAPPASTSGSRPMPRRLVSSDASPTRPEWAVTCSPPAARAAAWNRSTTTFGESGNNDAVLERRASGG